MSDDILYIDHHGGDEDIANEAVVSTSVANEENEPLHTETAIETTPTDDNDATANDSLEEDVFQENPSIIAEEESGQMQEQEYDNPDNTDDSYSQPTENEDLEKDPFDDIQSKMIGYPLPTPEISNISPPPPPQSKEQTNEEN